MQAGGESRDLVARWHASKGERKTAPSQSGKYSHSQTPILGAVPAAVCTWTSWCDPTDPGTGGVLSDVQGKCGWRGTHRFRLRATRSSQHFPDMAQLFRVALLSRRHQALCSVGWSGGCGACSLGNPSSARPSKSRRMRSYPSIVMKVAVHRLSSASGMAPLQMVLPGIATLTLARRACPTACVQCAFP